MTSSETWLWSFIGLRKYAADGRRAAKEVDYCWKVSMGVHENVLKV